jgi:hypothetical protein
MSTVTISWTVPSCSLLHTECKVCSCHTPVHNAVKHIDVTHRHKQTVGYTSKSAHLSKLCDRGFGEGGLVYLVDHIQVYFVEIPCSVMQYYVPRSYNFSRSQWLCGLKWVC